MSEAKRAIEAIDKLLEVLLSARERPHMYFQPANAPSAVIQTLYGMRTGMWIWGVDWSPEHRKTALDSRGIEEKAAWNEDDLEKRGLSPSEVVHELLSIEIEMWQAHRQSIASNPATG